MRERWFRAAWISGTALLIAGGACTILVDHSSVQCRTDADCAQFEGHPVCRSSLCVASGLCPNDCVSGPPRSNSDFLNACTSSGLLGAQVGECLAFDNCGRVGLCGPSDGGAPLTPPALPDAGPPVEAGVGALPPLPMCRDSAAGRGSVVYISGSSNFIALLKKLAPIVTSQTGLVPVFRQTNSCTGARSMYPANAQTDHIIRDPVPGPNAIFAQYYDADGSHDCLLGAGGVPVDVGESEIFPETCGLARDAEHVSHHPGPILPILFVVPKRSLESTISAAAARQVLGNGGLDPWTDISHIFIRAEGTATTRLIGLAIDVPVPPNHMWGIDQGSAQKLATALALVTDYGVARQSIGLLGADSYDTNRLDLKALAFQANGQGAAFLPDSTLFSYDKINVRDGHYPIWGTLHFFAAVSGGTFVSAAAQSFIEPFTQAIYAQDILDAFIDSHWIPECAMKVQRLTEMGEFHTDLQPAYPCGCYFDARMSPSHTAPAACHACNTEADCAGTPATPACNYGYCESR